MIRLFLLGVMLFFIPISYAAAIIKCKNEDGSIYFTDKRCNSNEQQTRVNPKTDRLLPQRDTNNDLATQQPRPGVQYLPIPE